MPDMLFLVFTKYPAYLTMLSIDFHYKNLFLSVHIIGYLSGFVFQISTRNDNGTWCKDREN